jgi:hypothetical protein
MVRRRDWSQAIVFQVGKKYQQSICSSACLCGNSDHCARVLSRRGFLASSTAAAAAPVTLATDTDRGGAQTMGSTTTASKLPADRAERLSPLSIVTTIVWSRCIRTSARTPNGVSWKSARRALSPISLANLDSRSKSESARRTLWVSYANGAEPSVNCRPYMDANAV